MQPFRTTILLTAFVAGSGCTLLGLGADPIDDVELLSDVTLAPEVEEASLVSPSEPPRILSDLLAVFQREEDIVAEPVAVVSSDAIEVGPLEDVPLDLVVGNIAEVGAAAAVEPPRTESTGGVIGFLTNLLPDIEDRPDVVAAPFVPPSFGEITAVCDVARGALGSQIAKVSGYTVYDSAPGSVQVRPHYVTGFNDRCPRRFDAALVLMGDIGTHELVRYSKTRVTLDYSETDEAYEAIKARFCGVRRGVPCGDRMDRLARDTTFITAYESFGAAPQWAEYLLHDGEVAAADIEG